MQKATQWAYGAKMMSLMWMWHHVALPLIPCHFQVMWPQGKHPSHMDMLVILLFYSQRTHDVVLTSMHGIDISTSFQYVVSARLWKGSWKLVEILANAITKCIWSKYNRLKNIYEICFLLTLKVPNKICSRWHFNFLLLSFEENKAWCFKWILCLAEDSLETSSLIFSEKQWKHIYECCLLQSWLAL